MIRRRFVLAGVVAAATLATLTVPVSRYAVWNATASVPTGLYLIRGKASLHVGERVAVEPPPPCAACSPNETTCRAAFRC